MLDSENLFLSFFLFSRHRDFQLYNMLWIILLCVNTCVNLIPSPGGRPVQPAISPIVELVHIEKWWKDWSLYPCLSAQRGYILYSPDLKCNFPHLLLLFLGIFSFLIDEVDQLLIFLFFVLYWDLFLECQHCPPFSFKKNVCIVKLWVLITRVVVIF